MQNRTKNDFEITWFSGSGAGGQHRNKHQNCVRLKDKETGIMTVGQNHKERSLNMKDALTEMANRLFTFYEDKDDGERVHETVRTYHMSNNYVKDHASGLMSSFDNFDLDEMIIARKMSIDEN